jgi:hypothetical protein
MSRTPNAVRGLLKAKRRWIEKSLEVFSGLRRYRLFPSFTLFEDPQVSLPPIIFNASSNTKD